MPEMTKHRPQTQMKDGVVHALLLRIGPSTTTELHDRIRAEEDEFGFLGLGPGYQLYYRLVRLRDAGRVTSKKLSPRRIRWTAVPDADDLPVTDPRTAVEGE